MNLMMPYSSYLFWDYDGQEYDDGGEYDDEGEYDEIIEEEIDEDYVFPMSAICKDNKSQSPGNKIDKETEAKLDKETENINDMNMMKLDCVDSRALDSSKDTFNVDDEAKGKGDSLSMPVPYKADEENLNFPLKSQECWITKDDLKRFKKKFLSHYLLPEEKKSQSPGNKIDKAKGKGDSLNMPVPYKADEENLNYPLKSQECLITSKDLKYQKKIRDFHIMIELKVFSLNRRLGEKFRSLVAVCKDDLERKMNVDGEYQKKIRDFDIMMDNEFFDLKGRFRKKFQSLVAICKDNKSQSQECVITSKDDLERKRNVDGEYQKKIKHFDIMIEGEFIWLRRRLINKFGSFVAVCKDNKSQSQECLITSQDDLERKRNVDGEHEKKIRDFDIMIEKEFFRLKRRLIKKFPVCKDNKSQSQECLITSKDDLKRKRNVDGEYEKKINGRKRRPIKKFQSLESHDEDYVGEVLSVNMIC